MTIDRNLLSQLGWSDELIESVTGEPSYGDRVAAQSSLVFACEEVTAASVSLDASSLPIVGTATLRSPR